MHHRRSSRLPSVHSLPAILRLPTSSAVGAGHGGIRQMSRPIRSVVQDLEEGAPNPPKCVDDSLREGVHAKKSHTIGHPPAQTWPLEKSHLCEHEHFRYAVPVSATGRLRKEISISGRDCDHCGTGAIRYLLVDLILPTAAVSKLAYYGLLMLAAHYLQLVDPRYYQAEMELRQMTLTKVRRAMTGSRWCDDDVFVTVMILCSHDISLHCDSTWLVHLKYYREYLVWRIRHPGLASARSPLAHYAASYFAAHTVLAKSLFSIADSASPAALALLDRTFDSCNTWTSTEFISSFMSTESLNEIDPWNGYSNSLLLLINEIACLREDAVAMHHHRLSQARIEAKIRLLETSLSRLSQSSPASLRNTDQQTLSHQRRLLEGNAEAYRLAAILFLNESSSPRFLGLATTNDAGPAIPLLDATKQQQYVSGVLERVRDIVMHTDLPVSWPLWPLFIAGCRTDAEEDRMTVLSLLQCAQRKKQYENIPRAQKVIELVWQHQDTQLDNDFGKKYQRPGTVGRYEWEVIMDLKGWRPSLA
ncbi:hypothetical protein H2204_014074 [Knufia peltigerae]|uniref:Fungal-specific transcription factor domain-containing protein n=1 Tax=Knufia peltigerae TaxID=1002370 RepID=A0AA38XMB4_9EURO|nr:hypothetical protein H2204_014074 [Knufia peltigerae]